MIDRACPNCGEPIKDHPENGCLLATLITTLRERAELDEAELEKIHESTNAQALWDDMGRILDKLQAGGYSS